MVTRMVGKSRRFAIVSICALDRWQQPIAHFVKGPIHDPKFWQQWLQLSISSNGARTQNVGCRFTKVEERTIEKSQPVGPQPYSQSTEEKEGRRRTHTSLDRQHDTPHSTHLCCGSWYAHAWKTKEARETGIQPVSGFPQLLNLLL